MKFHNSVLCSSTAQFEIWSRLKHGNFCREISRHHWITTQFGKKLAAFLFYIGFNVAFYFVAVNSLRDEKALTVSSLRDEKEQGTGSRSWPRLWKWVTLFEQHRYIIIDVWCHNSDKVTILTTVSLFCTRKRFPRVLYMTYNVPFLLQLISH